MKKTILALAFAVISLGTISAFAQTESSAPQQCEQTQKPCCKGEKGKKKHGDRQQSRVSPFQGIELTAEQQQQIDKLRAERRAKADEAKKAKKEAKAQERSDFDNAVAQILTPEQYAQYKANCDSIKAKRGKAVGKAKAHKKGNKGKREGRGQN